MKKVLIITLALIMLLTACGDKTLTNTEIIANHFSSMCKTDDSSVIRNELSALEKLSTDETLSEDERLFALYTYNIAYGVAKLSLSGKAISVFDFPDLEILTATIPGIASGELEIMDEMISESERFVQRVEDFIN